MPHVLACETETARKRCGAGGDIPILVLVLFVDAAHQRGGGWQDLVDEDEDGLLG